MPPLLHCCCRAPCWLLDAAQVDLRITDRATSRYPSSNRSQHQEEPLQYSGFRSVVDCARHQRGGGWRCDGRQLAMACRAAACVLCLSLLGPLSKRLPHAIPSTGSCLAHGRVGFSHPISASKRRTEGCYLAWDHLHRSCRRVAALLCAPCIYFFVKLSVELFELTLHGARAWLPFLRGDCLGSETASLHVQFSTEPLIGCTSAGHGSLRC